MFVLLTNSQKRKTILLSTFSYFSSMSGVFFVFTGIGKNRREILQNRVREGDILFDRYVEQEQKKKIYFFFLFYPYHIDLFNILFFFSVDDVI